jgi:hypothetical protein
MVVTVICLAQSRPSDFTGLMLRFFPRSLRNFQGSLQSGPSRYRVCTPLHSNASFSSIIQATTSLAACTLHCCSRTRSINWQIFSLSISLGGHGRSRNFKFWSSTISGSTINRPPYLNWHRKIRLRRPISYDFLSAIICFFICSVAQSTVFKQPRKCLL